MLDVSVADESDLTGVHGACFFEIAHRRVDYVYIVNFVTLFNGGESLKMKKK